MRHIKLISHSEKRTRAIAHALAPLLRGGDVIALHGDLGAGKTCFVRGLAEGLGIDAAAVSSPTFIILQEYGAASAIAPSLAHLDWHRLASIDELETIGWDELLDRTDCVVAVEWAERFTSALPGERIDLRIEHLDEHARRLLVCAPEALEDRLAPLRSLEQRENRCPSCNAPVAADQETFPFCSDRCRLADLGNWFGGHFRISRAAREDDWSDEGNAF